MEDMQRFVAYLEEGMTVYARNEAQATEKYYKRLLPMIEDTVNNVPGHYKIDVALEKLDESDEPVKVTMDEVRENLLLGKDKMNYGDKDEFIGRLHFVDANDELQPIDIHSKEYSLVDLLSKELYIA